MTATLIRLISGAQPRWRGCEPPSADGVRRIYFANHTSHLDALVIWASLPPAGRRSTRPVAARDYWEKTAVRRWLASKLLNAVMIDRERVTKSSNPLPTLTTALERSSLILFPQGTRSDADENAESPFKPGLWHKVKRSSRFPRLFVVGLSSRPIRRA